MIMKTVRLNSNEYVPYQKMYLDLVLDKPIVSLLLTSLDEFIDFCEAIEPSKLNFAYSEGKWTVKEVLLHIIDTERVFQYRALRFSRKDKTILPGFSESDFVSCSQANSRSIASLLLEFKAVRMSTIALFETFNDDVLLLLGNSGENTMSVRGVGYLVVGHQTHHINIIKAHYLV